MMKPIILVVEDEAFIALDLKTILDEEGFNTIINCQTVEDAITFINGITPDLVILDYNLQAEKSGIDLAHFLMELQTIPYMFITSYSDKLTLEKIKYTRPMGYLVKPFKPVDVLAAVNLILYNFQHRKIDAQENAASYQNDTSSKIKLAIDFINENITEKIELADLAKLTNWENEHFGRVFKKKMGISPYQYIMKQKVGFAKGLLTETDDSVNEIALKIGFNSYSNFFIAFKKNTDTTPEEYRNSHKKK